MRILMVTPYAPWRDGIGAYAIQSVRRLRREGHDVEVLSPMPSAAHHCLNLTGWRGPLALAKRTPRYDRVIIQFHPDVFYPRGCSRRERLMVSAGLALALRRAPRSEIVVHEFDSHHLRRPPQRDAFRAALLSAGRVAVHTETERRRLAQSMGLPVQRVRLLAHGRAFVPRTRYSQAQARESLGLPADGHLFLCIGFIQPHKGFDRALRAFGQLGGAQARLYVVGSVRVEEPEYVEHLQHLKAQAALTPGAEVIAGYLSDELFDRWIVAADTVVLPYRMIWSSGVMERAALYRRRVIASDTGGLPDQAPSGAVLVGSDEELLAAMATAAGRRSSALEAARPQAPPPPPRLLLAADASAEDVMQGIRTRAGQLRGPDEKARFEPAASAGQAHPGALAMLPPLAPPTNASRSRVRRWVKRGILRMTGWEIDPLVAQINAVHRGALEALREQRDGADRHGH